MMNTRKTIGIVMGMICGICWALDTLLLGIVLQQSLFSSFVFLAPFLVTFLHDAMSALWVLLYMFISKQVKHVITAWKSKNGWIIVIAAICGGPLGMSGYLLSIQYIGSAYTAVISAMYPVVGAVFAYLLFKEKMNRKGMVGLLLVVVATILLGFHGAHELEHLGLGLLCALVCVFGWGLESVICAYGMKEQVNSDVALQIRQATSAVVYLCVILPLIGGYSALKTMLDYHEILLAIGGISLIGSLSYLCY